MVLTGERSGAGAGVCEQGQQEALGISRLFHQIVKFALALVVLDVDDFAYLVRR